VRLLQLRVQFAEGQKPFREGLEICVDGVGEAREVADLASDSLIN
jgi:hypothetical protein